MAYPARVPDNSPDFATRIARARFRAWHRGTREADYMVGGFFDRYHESWGEAELAWYEMLLDRDDHDILAWVLGGAEVPPDFAGEQMALMQKLDYVTI
ncbi:succinate dehydrogenase assembly factor 2 [Altererythrobacter sp. CAU 1778]